MEDDDLATLSQRLIDSMDGFMGNQAIQAQLTAMELVGLRVHRDKVSGMLTYYRAMSGFTERRFGARVSSKGGPARVGVSMGGMLGAMTIALPAAGTATGGGSLLGVATTIGEVLLPIGIALVAAGAVNHLTGGSLRDVAAGKLVTAANRLMGDLIALGAFTSMMAVTAVAAAAMTDKQLIDAMVKAMGGTLATLMEEFLRRYPACAGAAAVFQAALGRFNRAKTTLGSLVGYKGGSLPNKWQASYSEARQALEDSMKALMTCMGRP